MPRLVDVRRPIPMPLAVIAMASLRVAFALAFAFTFTLADSAHAQREFVEEVDKDPLADVDLDAPDPAEAEKARKKLDPTGAAQDAKDKAAKDAKDVKDAKDAVDAGPGDKADPADPADPAARAADKDAPFEGQGTRILETSLDAYLEKWDVRALTVRKGEAAKAKKLISDVDEAMLDFGVQGIPGGVQAPATAHALLLEGRRALEEGSIEEATALVEAAERAAPDLVAVHTQRAHVLWAAGDLGGTLNSLVRGLQAHARDPLTTSQVGVRALAVVLAAIVLLVVLLAALAGLPALRLLSFDLLHVLPKGAHSGQVLALVVMGAVAPLVVGAGPVFGALWILSLAWLYLSTRERVLTGIVAVACLALPFGVDALARLASFPGSRADRAHRALFDAHAEPLRLALWAQAAPSSLNPPAPAPGGGAAPAPAPGSSKGEPAPEAPVAKPMPVLDNKALDAMDDYELAALAMWHKREGRLPVARVLLEKITARNPDAAFAHGELGVVNALEGNESVALVEMGKALAADADAHAAAFDASVLHYRGGRTDKAESAVAPVAKGAPDLLNAFRRTTYRAPDQTVTHNRAFVDVLPPPLALLRSGLASTSESQSTADAIARPLLRGQLGTRAAAVLLAFPIAWLVLLALRKKIEPCQGCVRCGHPASRRVDGKDVPADTCSQCFHAFVSTRSRIDAGVKLRKEREIITRRTRLGRVILVLGVLLPGAGHIFAGATVRGLVFALLHTLGLGALLFASGTVPMPQLAGPWSPTVPLVLCGIFVAVVWLVSLRSAWILSEEASGRGRR